MNSEPIRWGILSTGHISQKFARALQLAEGAELYAVASRTQEKAEAFAATYGVSRAYGSYEAMAADPAVDVIYIGTPHIFHLENAVMCMRAGKAVLCEKALTINAREAEEMIRVAREENVFLMEAMIPRHVPLIRRMMTWLQEGRIGEVRMIRAARCLRRDFADDARQVKWELGGGSLLDLGVYPISFASMVMGGREPEETTGTAYIGRWGTDEQGAALLRYNNGVIADVAFALRTETVNDAYIFGTEGYIHLEKIFAVPEKITLYDKEQQEVEVMEEKIIADGLYYEALEVMRCLREGLTESPYMPLDESLQIMRTLDRIRQPWGLTYPGEKA